MSDALLSPAVGIGFHAASAGLLVVSARRAVREEGYERRLPLMGVLGAFVFAAQMVTFAIPGTGSSGHLAGGVLLAIALGPSAAFLVMASVLTVQALFFADGGLLALGCNVFNLGFWPAFVGIALYRRVTRAVPGGAGLLAGAVAASVVSLELGAIGVAAQTALSGRAEVSVRDLALLMAGIHLPIAIVEGVVTAGVVRLVARVAPDRVEVAPERAGSRVPVLATLAGIAVFLATVAASFASRLPDGLTWSVSRSARGEGPPEHSTGVAALLHRLQDHLSFLPGYSFEGAERHAGLDPGTATSGLVGSLLVAATVLAVAGVAAAARRSSRSGRGPAARP